MLAEVLIAEFRTHAVKSRWGPLIAFQLVQALGSVEESNNDWRFHV